VIQYPSRLRDEFRLLDLPFLAGPWLCLRIPGDCFISVWILRCARGSFRLAAALLGSCWRCWALLMGWAGRCCLLLSTTSTNFGFDALLGLTTPVKVRCVAAGAGRVGTAAPSAAEAARRHPFAPALVVGRLPA